MVSTLKIVSKLEVEVAESGEGTRRDNPQDRELLHKVSLVYDWPFS